MFITVCVIAYNEEQALPSILEDIVRQDYPHNKIEVVLVNSASTDQTRALMEAFQEANNRPSYRFARIVVLDNPKKTLPCGWNVALSAYTGEAILKVDAHAAIPVDFVRKNVAVLESGEDICGGQRPNIIDEPTKWRETLLLAETSMFGSSIAPYRNNPGKTYVNSMFHAAYRREVFERIGGFNEDLARTEDNEIHYRMREAGFRLCFEPGIVSYQHIRSSLKKMLRQKYANGYWIGLTCGVCPKCLSLYHFVPFAFVSAILISLVVCIAGWITGVDAVPADGWFHTVIGAHTVTGTAGIWTYFYGIVKILTIIMWSLYGVIAIGMAVLAEVTVGRRRNITGICLPVLFLLLHISYGIGTVKGLIKMPFWVKGLNNGRDKKR